MQEFILQQKKRRLIEFLLEKNILIEPEFLEQLQLIQEPHKVSEFINKKLSSSEGSKEKTSGEHKQITKIDGTVRVAFSYTGAPEKVSVQNFISYFNARYNSLKKILQQRVQLQNITSIAKLKAKAEKENVSIIGMVFSKEATKNGNMVTLEDPTGLIKVFFSKNKADVNAKANDIVMDEVVGVSGMVGKGIIFANDLFFPDIPIMKEIKKSPVEEYALFISDMHIGSKQFLENEFLKFIHWICGEIGSDKQKEIASKVKYIFITGDAVDGISVYPSQKEELTILTYREQYKKLAEFLQLIPSDIKIIISPGNHDVMPIAEPQPPIAEEYCPELWNMPNVIMVSNPAVVNIAARQGFPGFDVLMYHGYSYNHYADVVESIRAQKPNISERADLVMKLLLQKRHLAPSYNGNPHLPTDNDYLIIEKVPDIFVSGDVHKSAVFTYKNVITGIIGSCFQSRTSFQEKVGHVPDPGRIPIINLKTRDVKILNFVGGIE